jgi:hypothetical protein
MANGGKWMQQPDIWGLTKCMLQKIYFLLVKTIPFLVQYNRRRWLLPSHKGENGGEGKFTELLRKRSEKAEHM